MKKIIFISIFSILFADNVRFYTFTLKENYKEYENNKVIDRDYNSWGDILGIGLKYITNYKNANLYIISELAGGNSVYKGAFQNGEPFEAKQNGVGLINLNLGINYSPYLIEIGYRAWNRGSSNNSGDYDETYYWSFLGIGFQKNWYINKSNIELIAKYKYAFNPKLKVYMGNEPILNLGQTRGFDTEFNYKYDFSGYYLGIFYRFSFWHIHKSNETILTLNNQNYLIYEPESITKNQYLGIYLEKSF